MDKDCSWAYKGVFDIQNRDLQQMLKSTLIWNAVKPLHVKLGVPSPQRV
jgi:hypothetical protein